MVRIGTLKVDSGNNGKSIVEIRVECYSVDDIQNLKAWLELAQTMMVGWEKIFAEASRTAEATAGKNEAAQPGKIQGQPQKT